MILRFTKLLHFAIISYTIDSVMATKSIQVRLDERLKKRVEKVLSDIGVDVPTAVRIFFTRVASSGGIPFLLQSEDEEHYTATQLIALDRLAVEAKKGKGLSRTFSSADELMSDLHSAL